MDLVEQAVTALQEKNGHKVQRAELEAVLRTNASTLLALPPKELMEVQTCVFELVETFADQEDGLNWLLGILAHLISTFQGPILSKKTKAGVEERDVLDHLQTLALLAQEYSNSGNLPSGVEFALSVFVFCTAFVAGCDKVTSDVEALITEVNSLRTSFKNQAAAGTALVATRCKAVHAQRDVLLYLVESSTKENTEADASSGQQQVWASLAIPSAMKGKLLNVEAVTQDTMESLTSLLEAANATPTLLTTVLSSLMILTRTRSKTWAGIINGVNAAVQHVFVERKGHSSLLKTSPAVQHALHHYLRFVIRIGNAVSFRHATMAALTASGGESQKAAAGGGSGLTLFPTSGETKKALPANFLQPVLADQVKSHTEMEQEQNLKDEEEGEAAGDDVTVAAGPQALAYTNLTGNISRLNVIAAMIVTSLKSIDHTNTDKIEVAHLNGLRQMQIEAAQRAQAAEVERIRQHESRSIAEVPPGRLVEHVDEGNQALEAAASMLENDRQRALFARSSFFSALQTCSKVNFESEGRMRHANAVVARSMCQLPPDASDAAMDAFCDTLEAAATTAAKTKGSADFIPGQLQELVMQALFMKYAQLAQPPTVNQFSVVALDFEADAKMQDGSSTAGGEPAVELHDQDGSSSTNGPFKMSIEDPAAWLSARSRKKRNRDLDDEVTSATLAKPVEFQEDIVGSATSYSHFFRRILFIFQGLGAKGMVEKLILEAPCITTPIWVWIYQLLCMSEDKSHKEQTLGVQILSKLIRGRQVYRGQALSLLLHLSSFTKTNTRILSILELKDLVQNMTPAESQDPTDWRQVILEYASKTLGRISSLRLAKFESQIDSEVAGGADMVAQKREARDKYDRLINRHLALFLVITSMPIHVTTMLKQLLEVFTECNRQNNNDAQSSLLRSDEFDKLFDRKLYESSFVDVLTEFRVMPTGSEQLVQHGLRIFAKALQRKAVAQVREEARVNRSSGNRTSHQDLVMRVLALKTACENLFDQTKDCRFIIPFLSFEERVLLKSSFIPALLMMMGGGPGPGASAAAAAESQEAKQRDMEVALREMLTPCRVLFGETKGLVPDRGLSPVDLLVYLHEVHQQDFQGVEHTMVIAGIRACLALKRPVPQPDGSESMEPLYEEKHLQETLSRLIKMEQTPTLTMHTAWVVARTHRSNTNLIRWITSNVVEDLIKKAVWVTDQDLWRGVIHYLADHWPGTSPQVFSLPEKELLAAITGNARLKAQVLEYLRANHNVPGKQLFDLKNKVESL